MGRLKAEQRTTFRSDNFQSLVDSGTTGISVPDRIFSELAKQVMKNNKCDLRSMKCFGVRAHDFPVIAFKIGGQSFPIRPEDYVFCWDDGNCHVRLQHTSGDKFILGMAFLSAYYSFFDADNLRIGFACPAPNACVGGTWNGDGKYMVMDTSDPILQSTAHFFNFFVVALLLFLFILFFVYDKAIYLLSEICSQDIKGKFQQKQNTQTSNTNTTWLSL
jgi:hypothetical protein